MLPRLNADLQLLVDVQQTAFSHDVLGRWMCSSWPEVSNNGGDPFDVVVIGAGMFGGYIADKLLRRGENVGLRVEATNPAIKVTLNGQLVTNYSIPGNTSRLPAGHIGLQCHTGNVQFQNVMIRALPN